MAQQIPTIAPSRVNAGDTLTFKLAFSDYPADIWTLTLYCFTPDGARVEIIATADGVAHLIDVAPAVTALYAPGDYQWVGYVSDGTDRHQVESGAFTVLPDLAVVSSFDARSNPKRILDAIESVIEGRANVDASSLTRNGRSFALTPIPELLQLRNYYASLVESAGNSAGTQIQTRFIQP